MGKSKSSSQANQSTTNTDKRVVNESGLIVQDSGGSTVNIERVDWEIVDGALSAAGEGYSKLLDISEKIISNGTKQLEATQAGISQAYTNAQTEKSGSIDQKTMIVLAVAGAAALVLSKGK